MIFQVNNYNKKYIIKISILLNNVLNLVQNSEASINITEVNFTNCILAQLLCHVHICCFLLTGRGFWLSLVLSKNILLSTAVLIAYVSCFFNEFYRILTIIEIDLWAPLFYQFLYFCFIDIVLRSSDLDFVLLYLTLELGLIHIIVMLGRLNILIKTRLIELLIVAWLIYLGLWGRLDCLSTESTELIKLIHHFFHVRNFRWLIWKILTALFLFFLVLNLGTWLWNFSLSIIFRIIRITSFRLLTIFQSFHNHTCLEHAIFSFLFPITFIVGISKQWQ